MLAGATSLLSLVAPADPPKGLEMSLRRPLLLELPTGRTWILRIAPISDFIPDTDNPTEFDEGLGLVAEALGGRSSRRVVGVHEYIARYGQWHPTVAMLWALHHPDTPFALAWEPPQEPWLWAENIKMFVTYRGHDYTRDRRGVLTERGDPDPYWPTRADLMKALRIVRESKQ